MKLILFFLPLALLAQLPAPGGGGGGGGAGGSGCLVSGSSNQIVTNSGSATCLASSATADSSGNVSGLSLSLTGAAAGVVGLPANATPGTVPSNAWFLTGNAAMTTSWGESSPNAVPSANSFKLYPAPTSSVSVWSWFTFASPLGVSGSTIGITGTIASASLPSQYKIWTCETGLGDGLNAMPSATYLQSFCYNTTGVTVTLTGIKCYADAGTPTMNAAGNTLGALLTGAVTCTTGFAAGTQSANVLLTSGDYIKFTYVAGGTATQTTWVVTGTY